ncbi:MAG: endonuclease/exonuclease/phosphatase family protein [Solirubrobacteraceae bacterium]|nr:endonuclease/exonuclease/phosphatase family protein [Solirubrobacteraceae bacterium]
MRVLTWNLYHGRADPPAGRDLLEDFAAALAGWAWDVALLQEVPPWWPPVLAGAAGAEERTALTSRNLGLALRRRVAQRWPDAIRSNGGGANAILVRGAAIAEHRVARLRLWPERRVVNAVALAGGPWVGNFHAQAHAEERAHADILMAAAALRTWAGDSPFVLGGDFNVRAPAVDGLVNAGGHDVDFVLARGLEPHGPALTLDRGPLSDHAPVLVELRR